MPRWKIVVVVAALSACAALASPLASPASAACRHAHAKPKSIGTKKAAKAVVCLLDKQRHRHGLGSLKSSSSLHKSSREHSRYMDRHGCFEHECPGEATLDTRLHAAGYLGKGLTRWMYGEDIAWGPRGVGSPKSIVHAWMHSPEHRAAILNPSYRDLGVGVAWGTPSNPRGDGGLYTADFGYRHG